MLCSSRERRRKMNTINVKPQSEERKFKIDSQAILLSHDKKVN